MAQKTTVHLIDDLDGGHGHTTVEFSLDGVTYEIDLSDDNAAKLRDDLARYVAAARKRKGTNTSNGTSTYAEAKARKEKLEAIRQWARQQPAYRDVIGDRGRIPGSIERAYDNRDNVGEVVDAHIIEEAPDAAQQEQPDMSQVFVPAFAG